MPGFAKKLIVIGLSVLTILYSRFGFILGRVRRGKLAPEVGGGTAPCGCATTSCNEKGVNDNDGSSARKA